MALSQLSLTTKTALASSARHADHYTSPKTLVLTVHDLPAGFGTGFTQNGTTVTNAQVATVESVSLSTMNRYRITGYQTSFSRRAKKGTVSVADSVGVYKSASAAHWQYGKFTALFKAPTGSQSVSMAGIGDEARGYTLSARSPGIALSAASLYIRRGRYTARVDTFSLGPERVPDLIRVAQVLDQRMRKAR
jgi:hypothetical protein